MEKHTTVALTNGAGTISSLTDLLTEAGIENGVISSTAGKGVVIGMLQGEPTGKVAAIHAVLDLENKNVPDIYQGVLAAIEAMASLKKEAKTLPGTVKLIVTVVEKASEIYDEVRTAAYLGYSSDLSAVISIQPDHGQDAGYGELVLHFFTEGVSFHGSAPQLGVNAINHMRIFLRKLDELLAPAEEKAGGYHVTDDITGGSAPNTIPDGCDSQVTIYTTPSQSHQAILDGIDEINAQLKEELRRFRLTVEVKKDTQDDELAKAGVLADRIPVVRLNPDQVNVSAIQKLF